MLDLGAQRLRAFTLRKRPHGSIRSEVPAIPVMGARTAESASGTIETNEKCADSAVRAPITLRSGPA